LLQITRQFLQPHLSKILQRASHTLSSQHHEIVNQSFIKISASMALMDDITKFTSPSSVTDKFHNLHGKRI
jgi:hypothetical protein